MAQVKAVPEGYHTVTPFLNVDGAREAIAFYKKAFGAEERGVMPTPDGKVMHAEIKIGDSVIMIADAIMNPATKSSLHLYVNDVDAAWKQATAAGCQVEMPLADQMWGDRWGMLSDRWGNRWGLATHKEDVARDEMKRRMDEMFKNMPKP
ncbi:MAG TPA: VOC family protein [Polyangia bacterium]|nr:VOC family protein [Polyangia bacterium]